MCSLTMEEKHFLMDWAAAFPAEEKSSDSIEPLPLPLPIVTRPAVHAETNDSKLETFPPPPSTPPSSPPVSPSSSTKASSNSNTWTEDEHARFLTAMKLYPRGPWRKVAEYVGTRTPRQTRTHGQKYRQKLERQQRRLEQVKAYPSLSAEEAELIRRGAKRGGTSSRHGLLWAPDEHERFLEAMTLYPQGPWKKISAYVGTRTVRQVMTHAQKQREKKHRRQQQQQQLRLRPSRSESCSSSDGWSSSDSDARSFSYFAPPPSPSLSLTGSDTAVLPELIVPDAADDALLELLGTLDV
ncbi:hypothetical protein PINS_up000848 [Pythium insidiosum]|nr:hypothetical protein PINS_up000848 [Pythium insidiosum]